MTPVGLSLKERVALLMSILAGVIYTSQIEER